MSYSSEFGANVPQPSMQKGLYHLVNAKNIDYMSEDESRRLSSRELFLKEHPFEDQPLPDYCKSAKSMGPGGIVMASDMLVQCFATHMQDLVKSSVSEKSIMKVFRAPCLKKGEYIDAFEYRGKHVWIFVAGLTNFSGGGGSANSSIRSIMMLVSEIYNIPIHEKTVSTEDAIAFYGKNHFSQ